MLTFSEISNKKNPNLWATDNKKEQFLWKYFYGEIFAIFAKSYLVGTSGGLNFPRGLKRITLHFWPKKCNFFFTVNYLEKKIVKKGNNSVIRNTEWRAYIVLLRIKEPKMTVLVKSIIWNISSRETFPIRLSQIQKFPPMTRLALLSKILGILAGWMMPPETGFTNISIIGKRSFKEIIIFG